jgi:hypothetical protein
MGLSRQEIIDTVGHQGKQVNLPTKGNYTILSMVRSCLNLRKEERPTFKEILNILQNKGKGGTLVQKKRKIG